MIACFTSFTFAYLPRALLLVRTLRAAHPDWRMFGLLVDEPPPGAALPSALDAFDTVVRARELGIPGFEAWMFKHELVEACTGVKGAMLQRLQQDGADKVIYLDPDTAVFHGLDPIVRRLDTASIVLTPHQIAPNVTPIAITDNERASLQYGVYNLGFLAVRSDANGRAFADWWADRLYDACYDAPAQGLFTDQRYCDLVPSLFDGVHIERDPGMNVASWNLSRRSVAFTPAGDAQVNGAPLRLYHFTKIPGVGEVMTERYASGNIEAHELVAWYKRELAGIRTGGCEAWPWHYAAFDNGTMITRKARHLVRIRKDLRDGFPHAFRTAGDSLHGWFERQAPELLKAA